ncbi:DUF374 domain-containing protein [Actomonas aquatica]|uniref:DUF374 domain-containing protein n=1 Tax=Actomonas aquatica TaxID=2866162 RepID=A0ABZ1C5V8_9BACT|nr:DUF374 domain-containing protein [Opitutus sp. WL0086]WRQ87119.1 DUF374 domain-containing protein [Opitutus sp. WL0086]
MSAADESTSPRPAAEAIVGRQRILLWLLGSLLKVWARTLRIEIADADRAALGRRDIPISLVIWHNRLFMGAECVRRYRGGKPFHGLISASKDGAWLVGFFQMMGIRAIRGSSSWGAREAANAMIEASRQGNDLGITPDGPRGPCYEFKPGGLIIARRAHTPLLLVGMEFDGPVKQLRSWDRFIIPCPFSRMVLRCRQVLPSELPKDRQAAIDELTRQMTELNGTRH